MSRNVVLDPGHGVETPGKRSPDGSYREHEFALDMAVRIKALLEAHGVAVVLTREDEHDISLTQRVMVSNAAQPDLFVSLHSNAAGSGGAWMGVRGWGVYTCAAGEDAPRNKAARAILARVREAGVHLWGGGLHHNARLTVLAKTAAPAVLIEHLFHDNKEDCALLKEDGYRQRLAQADAAGILDYLGIEWGTKCPCAPDRHVILSEAKNPDREQEDSSGGSRPQNDNGDGGEASGKDSAEPWWEADRRWAVERGISDGERPGDGCTRAEVWAMLRRMKEGCT